MGDYRDLPRPRRRPPREGKVGMKVVTTEVFFPRPRLDIPPRRRATEPSNGEMRGVDVDATPHPDPFCHPGEPSLRDGLVWVKGV